MADIEGRWYDNIPQQQPERNDQERVNIYTTLIIQLILTNPCISAVQIIDNLSHSPQMESRSQIMRLFRGWNIFVKTIKRMEPLRTAITTGGINKLPVTTRAPVEGEVGETMPEPDGFISWWAPQVDTNLPPFLFSMVQPDEDRLRRYPHQGVYTDDESEGGHDEIDTQSEDS